MTLSIERTSGVYCAISSETRAWMVHRHADSGAFGAFRIRPAYRQRIREPVTDNTP